MNIDQWYKHPTLRADLEEILKNPVLIAALEIVKDKGATSTAFPSTPVDLVQYFAIMGAKRDGYLEGLKNLKALTLPQITQAPLPRPWDASLNQPPK